MTETSTPTVYRTYKQGAFQLYETPWGKYLGPTIDPDANVVEFKEEHFNLFELNENIHQIPSSLWSAWIDLCFHYAEKINKDLEVSIRILRSESDPSQYKFIVPKQEVSKASVRIESFQDSVDLITGEELTSYPPDGWTPIGSSHSHNTMDVNFSSTDDNYELSDPGIHVLVKSINLEKEEYGVVVSVTANNRRFIIGKEDETRIIDFENDYNSTYHEKVLEYVSVHTPKVVVSKGFTGTRIKGDVERYFIGNFKDFAKPPSVWEQDTETLNPTSSSDIEYAIQEYVDTYEYDSKKLKQMLDIIQTCEDTITSQLMEIESTFNLNLN